jgi:hypothetical protein
MWTMQTLQVVNVAVLDDMCIINTLDKTRHVIQLDWRVMPNCASVDLTRDHDRCIRAVMRRVISVHGRRTPGWARNVGIVRILMEHAEWKSVISGASTKLTLMQCIHRKGEHQRPWGALNTRVVTVREAMFIGEMVSDANTNWSDRHTPTDNSSNIECEVGSSVVCK